MLAPKVTGKECVTLGVSFGLGQGVYQAEQESPRPSPVAVEDERESRPPSVRRVTLIATDRRARRMSMSPQRIQALDVMPKVAGASASSRS